MPFYYFTAPGGGFSTGMVPALIDKVVNSVARDGVKYRLKEGGLPSGKEFNFDLATGEVAFDTNGSELEAGEFIDVEWQEPDPGPFPPMT